MHTVSHQSHSLKVDAGKGIIRGVSAISIGEAKGHGLRVTRRTLEQLQAEGQRIGKVPVRADHGSGVMSICGHLINFRIQGNQLLADWKLLKSFPGYGQILEMAQEQPETIGLSASFVSAEQGSQPGQDKMLEATCAELLSVDLVIHPAANPTGLFAAKVNGQLVEFSMLSGLKRNAALGIIGAALIGPGLKKAAGRKIGKAIRHPLTKAAGYGAAGAAGASAINAIADRRRKKREEEEAARQNQFSTFRVVKGARVPYQPGPHRFAMIGAGQQFRKAASTRELAHWPGRAIAHPPRPSVPMHLSLIADTVTEFDSRRVAGPIRRPERAGGQQPVGAQPQARDQNGMFQPGQQSTPETMRKAYAKPAAASRFKIARMAIQRQRDNSNI